MDLDSRHLTTLPSKTDFGSKIVHQHCSARRFIRICLQNNINLIDCWIQNVAFIQNSRSGRTFHLTSFAEHQAYHGGVLNFCKLHSTSNVHDMFLTAGASDQPSLVMFGEVDFRTRRENHQNGVLRS